MFEHDPVISVAEDLHLHLVYRGGVASHHFLEGLGFTLERGYPQQSMPRLIIVFFFPENVSVVHTGSAHVPPNGWQCIMRPRKVGVVVPMQYTKTLINVCSGGAGAEDLQSGTLCWTISVVMKP